MTKYWVAVHYSWMPKPHRLFFRNTREEAQREIDLRLKIDSENSKESKCIIKKPYVIEVEE